MTNEDDQPVIPQIYNVRVTAKHKMTSHTLTTTKAFSRETSIATLYDYGIEMLSNSVPARFAGQYELKFAIDPADIVSSKTRDET